MAKNEREWIKWRQKPLNEFFSEVILALHNFARDILQNISQHTTSIFFPTYVAIFYHYELTRGYL